MLSGINAKTIRLHVYGEIKIPLCVFENFVSHINVGLVFSKINNFY